MDDRFGDHISANISGFRKIRVIHPFVLLDYPFSRFIKLPRLKSLCNDDGTVTVVFNHLFQLTDFKKYQLLIECIKYKS